MADVAASTAFRVCTAIADLRVRARAFRAQGRSIGLVFVRKALHEGHRALIERSVAECDETIVALLPRWEAQAADVPEDRAAEVETLRAAGVSVVFTPERETFWPDGDDTRVVIPSLPDTEADAKISLMLTSALKLLCWAQPTHLYFGEKYPLRLAALRRMVCDLALDVTLVSCGVVRNAQGLPASGGGEEDLVIAAAVRAVDEAVTSLLHTGARSAALLVDAVEQAVRAQNDVTLARVHVVGQSTMQSVESADTGDMVLYTLRRGDREVDESIVIG